MKPLIFFVQATENNIIHITKEDLEKMVQETYNSGFTDGRNSNSLVYRDGGTNFPTSPIQITCRHSSDDASYQTTTTDANRGGIEYKS